MRCRAILLLFSALQLFSFQSAFAQTPQGSISGLITDSSNAGIPQATVNAINRNSGIQRSCSTSAEGRYIFPNLPPGDYLIEVVARGFRKSQAESIVEAGSSTIVNFPMRLGLVTDTVTANSSTPETQPTSSAVSGVVTRSQIESIPLNGRDFLELAKLEPGALQPTRGSNNRTFVAILNPPSSGNAGRGTRVTVDGGSVMQIGNGGAAMGLSQEAIQEFQVSIVNFDLSTGPTASGAINVVTRSGGSYWHGDSLYYFRSHVLSAYPSLKLDEFNPHPFFQRQQYGVAAGGSIVRKRLFVFGTFERNDQRGVVNTEILTPEFASFSRISASPSFVDEMSFRLDWQIDVRNSIFLRESHQGGFAYGPTTVNGLGARAYPSAWTRQPEWTDQSIFGWTSTFHKAIVNDLRLSYFYVSSAEQAPTGPDCPGCLGIGVPEVNVSDLFFGTSTTTSNLARRYHTNDVASVIHRNHLFRFGGDWEITRGGRLDTADDPVTVNLFSPKAVRDFNALQPPSNRIPLPAAFTTIDQILQLPLMNFIVGEGSPQIPGANFGSERVSTLLHVFLQDTWRVHQRFTATYGLAWTYGTPENYDLRKPDFLRPILGEVDLAPTRKNWKDFSPSAGFAWTLDRSGKTSIHGGGGIYYDFQTSFNIADPESVSLGPRGVGRVSYVGAGIPNPLLTVPGVPAGTLLQFVTPTLFAGTSLFQALPAILSSLEQRRQSTGSSDALITNIEVDKQGSIVATHFPDTSAIHFSVGIQRELPHEINLSADFAVRKFADIGQVGVDLNHFHSARGPVLPVCTQQQSSDPSALCSLGPINQMNSIGSASYKGLLLRASKRFNQRWQFLCSYAFSSEVGNNFTNGFDNDNPLSNYGPLSIDFRHVLSISGILMLPKKVKLGLFSNYVSRPPFSVYLGGIDLNGDGTVGDLLPGTTVNEFNRGLDRQDLRRLVSEFNSQHAGTKDAMGTFIPLIKLPTNFEFGDQLFTQDLQVSRDFSLMEHFRLQLIAEGFNILNTSNLSGRSGDLLSPGFGQPRSRITQVFGSGGPRAFQFGMRLGF